MKLESTLKPCPFCGGEAFRVLTEWGTYMIQCGTCNACIPPHYLSEYVTEAWNRRTGDGR